MKENVKAQSSYTKKTLFNNLNNIYYGKICRSN